MAVPGTAGLPGPPPASIEVPNGAPDRPLTMVSQAVIKSQGAALCISCRYSVAWPGRVRVLLWVSICHPSPSSVHNNIPKGSDPASSLRPKAGAGDAEFWLLSGTLWESGAPWCCALAEFGACRTVWFRPHSVLGATSSSPGADASTHLLHGDLRGTGDSEVELPELGAALQEGEGVGFVHLLGCLAGLVWFAFEEVLGALELP